MASRFARYDRGYRPLQYRAGVGRLQVAVNDAGLITGVSIAPAVSPTTDARPLLADVVLDPSLSVLGDGRWVGWEWQADTAVEYVVSYRLDGVLKQITVPALPSPPDGVGAAETVHSALHTGVWLERRRIRLEGSYPAGGFSLADIAGDDVALLSAHCNDYYVGFIDGSLHLYGGNYVEVVPNTNVSTEVSLVLIHHRL